MGKYKSWTEREFRAYLFLYAADSNFEYNAEEKSFIESMNSFSGLPHRFEIFMKKKDIIFVNDSKATTFKAASAAIAGLKNIFWPPGSLLVAAVIKMRVFAQILGDQKKNKIHTG